MQNYAQSKYASKAGGKFGSGTFTPRKPVKTFRDLDIYQMTLNCAVIVMKDVVPVLESFGKEDKDTKGKGKRAAGAGQSRHGDVKYPFIEGVVDCAMNVPLSIGEAHSIRFGDFPLGLRLIEKAMSGCNKMIIYLEHIKGMYGAKVDQDVLDEVIARYAESRTKTFHLEQSWKKWSTAPRETGAPKVRL